MDKSDLLVGVLCLCIMLITIYDVANEVSLPEHQKSKYTQNKIVDAMSIEEYNKSYNELTIPEKEHIIREYQINTYAHQENTHPVVIPVPFIL